VITLAVEKGIAPTCENSRAHEVIIERGEIKSWCEHAQHASRPIKPRMAVERSGVTNRLDLWRSLPRINILKGKRPCTAKSTNGLPWRQPVSLTFMPRLSCLGADYRQVWSARNSAAGHTSCGRRVIPSSNCRQPSRGRWERRRDYKSSRRCRPCR
jgi:hypothetical protein